MIGTLLKTEALRRRIAFAMRNQYFADLNIAAPIGAGLRCPIVHPDYWWSFEEVFFSEEYLPVLKQIPLPNRWLDLGCHAGFFSLLLVAERRRKGGKDDFEALLVDGDSRVKRSIEAIKTANNLQGSLTFLHGAIASRPGELLFHESEVMSSSVAQGSSAIGTRRVAVARPEEIMAKLPPPYDLVKIDVEGAEHDFLTSYQPILAQTRHLLLEWHSWHSGGGGLEQIRESAKAAGFREIAEVVPPHEVAGGENRRCGVLLFEREK